MQVRDGISESFLMRTLVVSQDSASRMFLEDVLRSSGYGAEVHEEAEAAWQSYERETPPLAIVDLMLPEQAGFKLCRRMRASTILAARKIRGRANGFSAR